MGNFGANRAYEGGALPGPRGVMGNAQTHCIQLPNTFAFARGAAGKPVAEADYVTVPLEIESESEAELTPEDRDALIAELELKMREAAKVFEFEKAAQFRDRIKALKASGIYEEAGTARLGDRG